MSTGGSSRTTSAGRLSVLVGALSVPAFVAVWELIARSRIVNAVLFPPPSAVAVADAPAQPTWLKGSEFREAGEKRVAAGR